MYVPRPTMPDMASVFMLASWFALGSAVSPSTVEPLTHLRIVLSVDGRLPPAVAAEAVKETADLWAPYAVTISALPPGCTSWSSGVATVLPVRLDGGRRNADAWNSPFGAVTFPPSGVPEQTIWVFYEAITRLSALVPVLGLRDWQQVPGLRDRVLGRIVGRVIAHEIGHILLRTPRHSTIGLMRAVQRTEDLVGPSRDRFTLTAADVARLRDVSARYSRVTAAEGAARE